MAESQGTFSEFAAIDVPDRQLAGIHLEAHVEFGGAVGRDFDGRRRGNRDSAAGRVVRVPEGGRDGVRAAAAPVIAQDHATGEGGRFREGQVTERQAAGLGFLVPGRRGAVEGAIHTDLAATDASDGRQHAR